jgi:hypothetical protein
MLEAINSIWFATRVRLLAKRAENILYQAREIKGKEEIEALEKGLNTCFATLELLLEYAKKNEVMSHEDHKILQMTYKKLDETRIVLEDRKLTWWQRLAAKIVQILPMIQELINILAAFIYPRNPTAGLLVASINRVIGYLPETTE